jgi:hypothetical protein
MAKIPGVFDNLSTNDTVVARIAAAHNATCAVLQNYSREDTADAEAARYAKLFRVIFEVIKQASSSQVTAA